MNKALVAITLLLASLTACRAQVPPNPTTHTCPPASGTAYKPLDQSTPATGLSYTDSKPTSGVYCYIVQAEIGGSQVSLPSNIAGPFTLNGTQSVDLTWAAAATGPTPDGYYISRAPATSSTLLAPTLGPAPSISLLKVQGKEGR